MIVEQIIWIPRKFNLVKIDQNNRMVKWNDCRHLKVQDLSSTRILRLTNSSSNWHRQLRQQPHNNLITRTQTTEKLKDKLPLDHLQARTCQHHLKRLHLHRCRRSSSARRTRRWPRSKENYHRNSKWSSMKVRQAQTPSSHKPCKRIQIRRGWAIWIRIAKMTVIMPITVATLDLGTWWWKVALVIMRRLVRNSSSAGQLMPARTLPRTRTRAWEQERAREGSIRELQRTKETRTDSSHWVLQARLLGPRTDWRTAKRSSSLFHWHEKEELWVGPSSKVIRLLLTLAILCQRHQESVQGLLATNLSNGSDLQVGKRSQTKP